MYVNVSSKDAPSLGEFARSAQEQFRQQAPDVVFQSLVLGGNGSKVPMLHFSATGDPGGNVERVTYVEGPTAYFILVLSARNALALQEAQSAFRELLRSFVPMEATVLPSSVESH